MTFELAISSNPGQEKPKSDHDPESARLQVLALCGMGYFHVRCKAEKASAWQRLQAEKVITQTASRPGILDALAKTGASNVKALMLTQSEWSEKRHNCEITKQLLKATWMPAVDSP